jgi:hypothetical protein
MTTEQTMLRIGAAAAIFGAIISVLAGMLFGNLTNEYGAAEVLQSLAARPRWYWPVVHLCFIIGAFLWVGAFLAIARSLEDGVSHVLGWLGAGSVMVGAAVHVADSSISGFGLAAVATAWASAPLSEKADLLRFADMLLYILNSTWSSVHSYFHGLPFILTGCAVALNRRYPRWLGLIGAIGGAGSLAGGVLMFFGSNLGRERLFIVFAQLVSLWMVMMGIVMWRQARSLS